MRTELLAFEAEGVTPSRVGHIVLRAVARLTMWKGVLFSAGCRVACCRAQPHLRELPRDVGGASPISCGELVQRLISIMSTFAEVSLSSFFPVISRFKLNFSTAAEVPISRFRLNLSGS